MAGGGEEAAIFNGLKEDAEQSMPSIAQVLSGFTDKTASTAEKSLDAHVVNDSNIAGDMNKITDTPNVTDPHETVSTPPGQTTSILQGLTKDDDAAANFKPKDEPVDPKPTDPAGGTPSAKDPSDFSGNPDFRSTPEDRAKFASEYGGYADDEEYVNDLKAANPDHPISKIPTEDLVAVRGYTGDEFYSQMNKALRTGDTAGLQQYDSHIRATTSGLNQLEPTTGTFHRGMNIDPANMDGVLSKYEPGQQVTEPYFMSTGKPFPGNVQFEVQSATGRDVSYLSHYPNESEVLFPPGSNFRVDSKVEVSPGNWKISMTDLG
jgi:NAD:arginine ADP-ribosyltransferase